MMHRFRKLGEIEPRPLHGEYSGISLQIKHVGMGSVYRWESEFEMLRIRELPRIWALVESLGGERLRAFRPNWFPESMERIEIVSEAGKKEDQDITRSVLKECLVGINGIETQDPVEWVIAEGLAAIAVALAIDTQSLRVTDPLAQGGNSLPSE